MPEVPFASGPEGKRRASRETADRGVRPTVPRSPPQPGAVMMRKTEPVTDTGIGRVTGGRTAVRRKRPVCVTHLSEAIYRQIPKQVTSARNGDQK